MRSRPTIIIGSRGSELAMWQSRWVENEVKKFHSDLKIDIRIIKTTGDKILDAPLSKIGDKGLFTKELEKALLDRTIDLAVHSFKDIPTNIQDGLTIAAICEREDVRDVFVKHPKKNYARLSDIPENGTVATGSLRRRFLLLQMRPETTVVDIRGNLGTRIEKLAKSEWDGMILAKAGISRLGRSQIITEILPPARFLPAVGQGALAIESREDDEFVISTVRALDHLPTRQATIGERALLRRLEGGCQVPIGTYGRIEKGVFKLDAAIGSLDGKRCVRSTIEGSPQETERLGIVLAEKLLADGGEEILDEIRQGIA